MTAIGLLSVGVTDDVRAGGFWRQALGHVRRPPRFDSDDRIVPEPPPGVAGVALAMDVSEAVLSAGLRTHERFDAAERPAEWTCPSCGGAHDRDVNAAKNILAAGPAKR